MKWNLEKYNSSPIFYQKFQILLLMENANTHLVSVFKDYLLYDDTTEFFKEYYKKIDLYPRLKTIYDYYESSSYLFPNYTAINEGKYIYRNIIKKQKLIDYLEDLEDKKKEKEEKILKKKKKFGLYQNDQSSSSCFDVFDTKVYHNIIKETGNDSKINELFCVDIKNSNDAGDSFASILKLTEEIKENKQKEKENKDNNINNNYNTNNNSNYNSNNISKNISNNISNIIKNKFESKIYVSRRVSINQNSSISKKVFKKSKPNININNFINNSNLNKKNIKYNFNKRNQNLNSYTCKSNDFLKNNMSSVSSSNNKSNYKKNNIIINIINNNKTNNYQSNINYISNYTSNNQTENAPTEYKNIMLTATNGKINNNTSNNKIQTSSNNHNKNNSSTKDQNELKSVIIKYSNNHSKNISKRLKKEIKSKLLSFRLTTDINLTDRGKNGQSENKKIKTLKDQNQSHTKSLITPHNNSKKRTKTEIMGNKTDIFLFGQPPNEINSYNYSKSINRQILKNINSSNISKPHKEMSLINKKILNYHFGLNSSKIDKKYVKHISTNSQNLTGIKIINTVNPLPLKEIIKRKTGIFSFNKTERTSRNHSKDKINKNNTMYKRNYLDSFSPKKSQDFVYKKTKKLNNKNSAIISSFLKSVSSSKKIKGLKINQKNYNSNNNSNYRGMNMIMNNKELFNRTNK